ncbi:MAG: nitroreductase family protein [Oscillospiraceae bacterium]
MEFMEALQRRYSCRRYTDQPVDRELLRQLMEAGRLAPSACNSQRWMFIAVDDPEKKASIAASMHNEEWKINSFAAKIPAFIAVIRHPVRNPSPMQQGLLNSHKDDGDWAMLDIGIAASQICLAATDLGLGSVMIGWYDREVVKQVLELPDGLEPALFIGVGHPENPASNRKAIRLPYEEIGRFNSYNS